MRPLLAFAFALALALAVGVAAWAVTHDDDGAVDDTGSITLVGDSLNVGIEADLAKQLPGWRIDAHDRVGRGTQEGIDELRRLAGRLAPVVVVSLGTNDPDGSEAAFRRLVDEAVDVVGRSRCLVWATVVRDGAARTGFNRVLEQARSEHPNIRLVEWAALVTEETDLLAADLVHGTPEGYARRAEEAARAIRGCPRA
jgi:lysophospholipase L1-like esterase